jgi:hypothetical protein
VAGVFFVASVRVKLFFPFYHIPVVRVIVLKLEHKIVIMQNRSFIPHSIFDLPFAGPVTTTREMVVSFA